MTNTVMSASLILVLEHLGAVRELDRYLHKRGADRDMARYIKNTLRPALQERLPLLSAWTCVTDEDCVEWSPECWKLGDDLAVALNVSLPSPIDLDDANPSVNLRVPSVWKGHAAFNVRTTACVKALADDGFGLAVEHDWDENLPVGKYVDWLGTDGNFDESDLIARIVQEAAKIVRLEPGITKAISEACSAAAPNKSKGLRRSKGTRRNG
jgi:hypothetical protein